MLCRIALVVTKTSARVQMPCAQLCSQLEHSAPTALSCRDPRLFSLAMTFQQPVAADCDYGELRSPVFDATLRDTFVEGPLQATAHGLFIPVVACAINLFV